MGGFKLHATARPGVSHRGRRRPLIPNHFVCQPADSETSGRKIHNQINAVAREAGEWPYEVSEADAARVEFGDGIWEDVLTFEALKVLLSEIRVTIPTITGDEINDRSKGNTLSKGIAILQLIWFIVQIIMRAVQGLAISELELTTAALAGLISIMYMFWWSKPPRYTLSGCDSD